MQILAKSQSKPRAAKSGPSRVSHTIKHKEIYVYDHLSRGRSVRTDTARIRVHRGTVGISPER